MTDISYIQADQGVLYLSMIRDLYGNSIVAYRTATHQTVDLVLETIRLAMRKEKKRVAAELQLHSGQGGQDTSQEYYDLTKRYGITPSMSRCGKCNDNAMAENFFSIFKTECIYRQKIATFQQARALIDKFINFCCKSASSKPMQKSMASYRISSLLMMDGVGRILLE